MAYRESVVDLDEHVNARRQQSELLSGSDPRGSVSLKRFSGPVRKHLEAMDAENDGSVTVDELVDVRSGQVPCSAEGLVLSYP